MARTYRRDSNGRFSSGGGSARGVKATTAAATKRGSRLGGGKPTDMKFGRKSPGTSAPAGTVAKGFYNRRMGKVFGQGKATKVRTTAAAKAKPAKMSKAAPNKAKAAYKAATSKAREAKMYAGGRMTTRGLGKRTDAGAQRIRASVKAAQAAAAKVRAMEKKRGVSGRKRAKKK